MKSKNYETVVKRTADAEVRYGHIHNDQVISSIQIGGKESLEYMTFDQTEPRKRWFTGRCRGRFQWKAGDDIPKDQPGIWLDGTNSDIVIRTGGRIRMEAENIDLIAHGGDNKNGIITLKSNEAVNIDTKNFSATGDGSIKLYSKGSFESTAINIMRMYGNDIQRVTARSALKPPAAPILNNITKYAGSFLDSGF